MNTKQMRLVGLWLAACLGAGLVSAGELRAQGQQEAFDATTRAEALYQRAEYPAAAQQYLRALELAARVFGPNDEYTAAVLCDMGNVYLAMGDYANAELIYKRSLKIREAILGPNDPQIAANLNNLGAVYKETSRDTEAAALYLRCLKIQEASLGPNHVDVAMSLNNLANLYSKQGQFDKAKALHLRSLKIRETKLGPNHPDVAQSLHNLASLYSDVGEFAAAEPLLERALKIREATLGPSHPEVAKTLLNMGKMYWIVGQLERAEPPFQRSLKICEDRLGPDHPIVASSLNNLAVLYVDMRKFDKAEPLYQRALKIQETALGPDATEVATYLSNIGLLHISLGQIDRAAQDFDRARRNVRRYSVSILTGLSEREQLTFLQNNDAGPFQWALSLGFQQRKNPQLTDLAYGWLLNRKAVAQQSLAERALLARDGADPALAAQIQQLLALRKQLAELSLVVPAAGQEAGHRQQLAELSRREQELSRIISLSAGRPAQDDPWVEPALVRSSLAKDSVLVDIARFAPCNFDAKRGEQEWQPARYVAWVIPPSGQGDVQIVDLGEAEAVDAAVAKAREAIEKSAIGIEKVDDEEPAEQAALAPLTAIAELVLNPLKPHLANVKQLILGPDSNLWLVPWAALPVEKGKYAIEKWEIRYVISGRDLVAEQSTKTSSTRRSSAPCIFADPDYDLDGKGTLAATRAVLRGKETPLALRGAVRRSASGLPQAGRLPATAVEARLITPRLESYAHVAPSVYTEQYALEGVLKMVQSPRVLVLSTHGYYLPDQKVNPIDDHASAAGGGANKSRGGPLTAEGKPLENPLLRCGMLLAGCNQRQTGPDVDDGVLTGMEIVGCDLRGTDLVVLSACQTGLGQVRNGEGVAGLRQAFQLAGAKAVVSTLWRIPDAETATLMSDFFNNLAAGQSKAEALASAQLALIKARRESRDAAHPFFWAAFTLTGK